MAQSLWTLRYAPSLAGTRSSLSSGVPWHEGAKCAPAIAKRHYPTGTEVA